MCYSLWYNAPTMLPASGRQHRGCIIPQIVQERNVLLNDAVSRQDNIVSMVDEWLDVSLAEKTDIFGAKISSMSLC